MRIYSKPTVHLPTEKRDGRWCIVRFESIYEQDRLIPVLPDAALTLDSAELAKYRSSYACMSYVAEKNGVLDTAREHGIGILAFGVLSHGLLSDRPAGNVASGRPGLPPTLKEEVIAGLREIAREKNTTVEKLAQAYVYAKNPDMSILIGTTSAAHLQDSIDALALDLSAEDVARIEAAFPAEKVGGIGMRNFIFRDGRIV